MYLHIVSAKTRLIKQILNVILEWAEFCYFWLCRMLIFEKTLSWPFFQVTQSQTNKEKLLWCVRLAPSTSFTFLVIRVALFGLKFHLEMNNNKRYRQITNRLANVLSWCFGRWFDFGSTFYFLNLFVRHHFSEVLCLHWKEWLEVEPADFSGTHSSFSLLWVFTVRTGHWCLRMRTNPG